MDYEKALKIGRTRADLAAEALRRWTGIKACAVCAVQPVSGSDPRTAGNWEPIGRYCYKEITRDNGMRGGGNYHLLVVDESGTVKACTLKRYPLGEVLELADRLPIGVAEPSEGELWKQLAQQEDRRYTVDRAKHPNL